VLRERGLITAEEVVQECAAGEIAVAFEGDVVALTATPRDLVGPLADAVVDEVIADLGLTADDRDGDAWLAGTGLTFLHLPVRSGAVARARVAARPLASYDGIPGTGNPLEGINLVAIGGGDVHARVFVPGLAVPEDPATGSAAAGLGLVMVASGRMPDGGTYVIRQGLEMGRPSRLECHVTAEAGVATSCRVAGRVHPVSRGLLRVPPR
jgi:trans-2,3-dihydro-3-hydroxyanthranilate isomerase